MMDAVMMTSEAAAVAATVSATRSDVVERLTAPEEPRSRAAIATIHCPRASLSVTACCTSTVQSAMAYACLK